MRKILATMMALALTIGAQGQQDDGLDAMMAAMIAAKIHQDSIDTSSLVAVYDYECQTQDADGKAVTDRMKVCPQVVQMLSLKDIASFLRSAQRDALLVKEHHAQLSEQDSKRDYIWG